MPASSTSPRISIVTLSFNQGRFLQQAIDSILGQDYPNLDYIVVDPGSKDDSRTIIAGYKHQLTALLEPDKGPADGLNKGFAAATGDIFGYINADDLLLPGALQTVARHFSELPQVDAILGNGVMIDTEGRTRRRLNNSRYSLRGFALGAMTFCQQGHFFRREAFTSTGGFNIANRTCWDAELFVDMALAGARFRNVPERLGAFRLYGETITGSGRFVEQASKDLARIYAKALGRPLGPADRVTGPLLRLARRLSDPMLTFEGARARLSGGGLD